MTRREWIDAVIQQLSKPVDPPKLTITREYQDPIKQAVNAIRAEFGDKHTGRAQTCIDTLNAVLDTARGAGMLRFQNITQKQISRHSRWSAGTISRYIGKLEELGLIHIDRGLRWGNGRFRANRYHIDFLLNPPRGRPSEGTYQLPAAVSYGAVNT